MPGFSMRHFRGGKRQMITDKRALEDRRQRININEIWVYEIRK